MRDIIVAGIRSAVQFVVAALVAALAGAGVELAADVETALVAGLFGVLVALLNWLGIKFPIINTLMSFGLSPSAPAYQPKHLAD